MIDTIHFRIYGLDVHKHLSDYLLKIVQKGQTRKTIEVDEETGEVMTSNKYFFSLVQYLDTGNESVTQHFNSLPSHHYDIAYRIDSKNDFMEFNLSIPKYIYGTNVFQLVPHLFDFNYTDYFQSERFDEIAGIYHDHFIKVFRQFLEKNLPKVNMQLLEIVRIDFCYNQVFNMMQDALDYLSLIKLKVKKYQRDTSNTGVSYDTTFFYKSKHYSFKVYHKGTEFAKHDMPKLRKLNEERKDGYFDLKRIKRLADNTLRYELTCRTSHLYNIYLSKIYFKTKLIKPSYQNWVKFKNRPDLLRAKTLLERKLIKQDIEEIDNVKNKLKRIVLVDSPNTVKLDKALMKEYLIHFFSFVQQYQSKNDRKKILYLNDLVKRAKDNNDLTHIINKHVLTPISTQYINKSKLLMIVTLLKDYSLDEIKKRKFIPKRTFDRYVKFLEHFGVDRQSNFDMQIHSSLDFKNYYQFCQENFNYLKNLVILNR